MTREDSLQAEGRVFFLLYNALLLPLRSLVPAYSLLARARGAPRIEVRQRMGYASPAEDALPDAHPRSTQGPVWMQAASVGEVGVSSILMTALEREIPSLRYHVTTTTRTGQAAARRTMDGRAGLGYFPLDFRGAVGRALDALRPTALLLIETELWPNLLREAGRRRIPVLLVNGRLSDRAFRRYRFAVSLLRQALGAVRVACVQTELDRDRFVGLGLPPSRARITGNLKFAVPAADADPAPLVKTLGLAGKEIWLAGSTAEGEEAAVIEAFLALSPPAGRPRILVLAPRRPERFDAVAKLLDRSGAPWIRRSSSSAVLTARVVLLDSLGELPALYRAASVAFIGGSLAPVGGHNIIEPAVHGVAPIFGPHIENVREVAARLLDVGGAFQVRDAKELAALFQRIANDPETMRRAGENARGLVERSARALDDTVREILPFLRPGPTEMEW